MKKTLLTALTLLPFSIYSQIEYPKVTGDQLIEMKAYSATEFSLEYDTNGDGIVDVKFGYILKRPKDNVYGVELIVVGVDRNKDGKIDQGELYYPKFEEMLRKGKKST